MEETIKAGWLNNYDGEKFAPKTIMHEIYNTSGVLMFKNLNSENNLGDASTPIYIQNGIFMAGDNIDDKINAAIYNVLNTPI